MWANRGFQSLWKQLGSIQDIKPGKCSLLALQFTEAFFSGLFHSTPFRAGTSGTQSGSLKPLLSSVVHSIPTTADASDSFGSRFVPIETIITQSGSNLQGPVSGLLASERQRSSYRYGLVNKRKCQVLATESGPFWRHRTLASEAAQQKKRGRPAIQKTSAPVQSSSAEQPTLAPEAAQKKKRGRPPKDKTVAPVQSSPAEQPTPLPTFEDCLRSFAPKIDDLETSAPGGEALKRMLAINAASSEKLLAFLDAIQPQAKGYPKAAFYDLDFFVVDGEAVQNVRLKFKTTGGDCKKQVLEDFERFFQKCGVAQSFRWSTGSWGALHIYGGEGEEELREKARLIKQSHMGNQADGSLKGGEDETPANGESRGGEDAASLNHGSPQAGRKEKTGREAGVGSELDQGHGSEQLGEGQGIGRALGSGQGVEILDRSDPRYGEHGSVFSATGVSSDKEKEAQEGVVSIEELINALDPALKLIAEFPWGQRGERVVVLEMLENFKKNSPMLGEAIAEKVWKGRLCLQDVCEGLSQRDVAIATSIVYHVQRTIEKIGRPKTWPMQSS